MKLDRNINADGLGKYALLKLRRLAEIRAWDGGEGEILDQRSVEEAISLLERAGILDWGNTPETEFFLIRLKDKYAKSGLYGYANAAYTDDQEYAEEIYTMGKRSGTSNPYCKKPD